MAEQEIPEEITYDVYWKGTVKTRSYSVDLTKELIETPMGSYEAYKVSESLMKEVKGHKYFGWHLN